MKPRYKLLAALVLAAASGAASASGFQLLEQNASGIGNAYAGSAAVAENASTVFFNPAGMTRLQAREYSFGLTAVKPSFKFRDQGSRVMALQSSGNGGDAGQWGLVPNSYFSMAVNPDVYFGLGLSGPFGLMTKYDMPWKGAAQSEKFKITTYNLNPSLAFRVNDMVSFGVGLNWQRIEAIYKRQAAVASANPLVPAQVMAATPLKLDVDDTAWGWNIGVLFTPREDTRIGLSYRSKIKYKTTGSVSASGPVPMVNAMASSNVRASVTMPDTFIASIAHDLDSKWTLLGDVSWTGWSAIPKLDIVATSGMNSGKTIQTLHTDFRDTWRVAVGANYALRDDMKLKFGVAYDRTPVKGATTRLVSLPDADRTWLSLGLQWKPTKTSAIDVGAAYLITKDGKINNNQLLEGRGHVVGTFKNKGMLFGVQYSASF